MYSKTILFIVTLLSFFSCKKDDEKYESEGNGKGQTPAIISAPDSVYILSYNRFDTFYISNNGQTTADWSLEFDSKLLNVNIQSSSLYAGSKNYIVIRLNKNVDFSNHFSTVIKLKSGNLHKDIVVTHGLKNTVFFPVNDITDAAFDKKNNFLYFISAQEKALYRYSIATNEFSSLKLNSQPVCISLSPDFLHAATGAENEVTLINLSSFSVTRSVSTNFKPIDIVINNRKMIYASSLVNNDYTLQWISPDGGSYYSLKPKYTEQHSFTNLMFDSGCVNIYASSENNIHKYRISNDTPYFYYTWPYSTSDYQIGSKVWINETKDAVYTSSGNIFKVRNSKALFDMNYHGRIKDVFRIESFDHCVNNGLVYSVSIAPGGERHEIASHNVNTFMRTATYQTSKLRVIDDTGYNEQVYAPFLHNVFCNETGTKLFVISNMKELKRNNTWSLETINIQ